MTFIRTTKTLKDLVLMKHTLTMSENTSANQTNP